MTGLRGAEARDNSHDALEARYLAFLETVTTAGHWHRGFFGLRLTDALISCGGERCAQCQRGCKDRGLNSLHNESLLWLRAAGCGSR